MAKIVEQSFKATLAKSFYNYVKNTDLDDTFYASVIAMDDSEYSLYTGYSLDSDSEVELFGGLNALEFDEEDKTFYSQSAISLHKLYVGGVSRVVERTDWKPNTYYNAWPDSDSHVLVKEYISGYARLNVYRCLFTPLTPSTYSPSGVSSSEIYLPDGYVWKYMYTISNSEAQRFLTADYMPVPEKVTRAQGLSLSTTTNKYRQYVVQQNAVAGDIYGFNIDSDIIMSQTDIETDSVIYVGARSSIGTPTTQAFSAKLNYDSVNKSISAELIQKGIGYVGQPIFYNTLTDSDMEGVYGYNTTNRGHGSDAPAEMFSNRVMLVARVIPEEDNLKVIDENEFNMIGLLKNPIDASTRDISTKDTYVACKSFTTTVESTFVPGEIIKPAPFDDGRRGKVISVKNSRVYYTSFKIGKESDTFLAADGVANLTDTKTFTIDTVSDREYVFNSGDLLVIDKKHTSFTRSIDSIESLSFLLKF